MKTLYKKILFLACLLVTCPFFIKSMNLPLFYRAEYNPNLSFLSEDILLDGGDFVGVSIETLRASYPFDPCKYQECFALLHKNLGITAGDICRPEHPVEAADLELVHTHDYITSLIRGEVLAQIFNCHVLTRLFPHELVPLLDSLRYATQGTIDACQSVLSDRCCYAGKHHWAINIGGGFHHAHAGYGEGGCAYADIAIAIRKILQAHPDFNIMVIDLDAHQGNGLASIFHGDRNVILFDVFNVDRVPYDKEVNQFIHYRFPLCSHVSDQEYSSLLERNLPMALDQERPNLIIYNAGTDILSRDREGCMNISMECLLRRDLFVFMQAKIRNIPIVMVLSGGYTPQSALAIALSIQKIIELEAPEKYSRLLKRNTRCCCSIS